MSLLKGQYVASRKQLFEGITVVLDDEQKDENIMEIPKRKHVEGESITDDVATPQKTRPRRYSAPHERIHDVLTFWKDIERLGQSEKPTPQQTPKIRLRTAFILKQETVEEPSNTNALRSRSPQPERKKPEYNQLSLASPIPKNVFASAAAEIRSPPCLINDKKEYQKRMKGLSAVKHIRFSDITIIHDLEEDKDKPHVKISVEEGTENYPLVGKMKQKKTKGERDSYISKLIIDQDAEGKKTTKTDTQDQTESDIEAIAANRAPSYIASLLRAGSGNMEKPEGSETTTNISPTKDDITTDSDPNFHKAVVYYEENPIKFAAYARPRSPPPRPIVIEDVSLLDSLPVSAPSQVPDPDLDINTEITSAPLVDFEEKRLQVTQELVDTESLYVSNLNKLVDHFIRPLKVSNSYGLSQQQVMNIFSNIELLASFHEQFLRDLQELKRGVASVFLKYNEFFKMYKQYFRCYETALQIISDIRDNKVFQQFLINAQKYSKIGLMTGLILPIQRIPKYETYLRELIKWTQGMELHALQAALRKIQLISLHIKQKKSQLENMSNLVEVEHKIQGHFTILTPHRRFLREGSALEYVGEGDQGLLVLKRHLFLFSDILLWTTSSFSFKAVCELSNSSVKEWPHEDESEDDEPDLDEMIDKSIPPEQVEQQKKEEEEERLEKKRKKEEEKKNDPKQSMFGFTIFAHYIRKSKLFFCRSKSEAEIWTRDIHQAIENIKQKEEYDRRKRLQTRMSKLRKRISRTRHRYPDSSLTRKEEVFSLISRSLTKLHSELFTQMQKEQIELEQRGEANEEDEVDRFHELLEKKEKEENDKQVPLEDELIKEMMNQDAKDDIQKDDYDKKEEKQEEKENDDKKDDIKKEKQEEKENDDKKDDIKKEKQEEKENDNKKDEIIKDILEKEETGVVKIKEHDIKYDRQIRMLGVDGQAALERAHICVLSSTTVCSEFLKNLVLSRVGSFTLVDSAKVQNSDLGANFLINTSSIGTNRADIVTKLLLEMNEDVTGHSLVKNPNVIIENDLNFFSKFSLIALSQNSLSTSSLIKLSSFLYEHNIPLIILRSNGLLGSVRIQVKEHTIVESKPEDIRSELYLYPSRYEIFPELREFIESFDINVEDGHLHSHIPANVILAHALKMFTDKNDGKMPNHKELCDIVRSMQRNDNEMNFQEALDLAHKVIMPPRIPDSTQQILNDPAASDFSKNMSSFWFAVASVSKFIQEDGKGFLPTSSHLDDLVADTRCCQRYQ